MVKIKKILLKNIDKLYRNKEIKNINLIEILIVILNMKRFVKIHNN